MSDNLPATPAAEGNQPFVPSHLSPQVVEQLVSNQARDLELRATDLALQQQKDNNGFNYAMKALDAQVADRKDERVHRCKMKDRLFLFVGGMGVLIASMVGYCLYSNHEAVAMEIIKFVAYAGIGSLGGYGYGKSKSNKSQIDPSDQN